MDELFNMLFRFGHILVGITWIGLLYYFNFVQTEYFKEAEEDARRKAAVEKAKKVRPRTATTPPVGSVKASDLDTLLMESISKAGVAK